MNAPAIDCSDAWASGGFLSTAEDLARYGQAMLEHELLSRDTLQLLWTPMQTADGERTGYGIGWQVRELAGHSAFGHGGQHVGATADFWVIPDAKLVVAVLTNANSTGLPVLAEALVQLFIK